MAATISHLPHAGAELGLLRKKSSPLPITTVLPTSTQVVNNTFYRLEEILIERCRSTPDIPMIGYPANPHTAEEYIYYTARQFDRFVNGAIQDLRRQGLGRPEEEAPSKDSPVVALLGPANLDYVVAVFALARMGYAVFYLSTRLSIEAYMSLLNQTDCHHIIHAEIPALVKSVSELHTQCNSLKSFVFTTQPTYTRCTESSEYKFKSAVEDGTKTAYIIHSSGSTGYPKAIPSIHKSGISNYTFSRGFESYFVTLPFYHGHGVSMFFRALFKGKPIALYNASLPLTGGYLVKGLRSTKPESLHCVPYALKLIAETDGGIEALAGPKQVLFGGSSCPDDLGDKLVAGGVHLISHYGATEFGQLMTSDRPPDDKAWNYLHPLPTAAPYLFFDPLDDGSFECVVLDGLPSKNVSNSDDPPNSFRTSDRFVKHPSLPNRWKYVGRLDDRVTLMNGEKVLPIPIEHRIRQNRLVKEVLVVGVGRLLPGLLIMPSENARGLEKGQILDSVWPDIAAANSNAEAFSQISKDMVEVLPVDVWYPQTEKGTLIRKACYKHFEGVIDELFDRASGSSDSTEVQSSAIKLALSVAGIEDFLVGIVQRDLGFDHIEPDTDFFTAGMDSLQAIKAYGIIKRHLDLGNGNLNQNALYEFGNIKRLAVHLHSLRTGEQKEAENELDIMAELIKKYAVFQKPVLDDQEVVLLTGVTGSLGCYILSKLLLKQSVRRVYCLVRASSADAALDRVISTLSARELPITNISKIRALPSNLSRPDLGLGSDVIHELRNTLTKVIHSAWAVNFNIGVRSFEEHHIAGVHNLINLCLSSRRQSPAEFYFCSSISVATRTPRPATIAEGPIPELSHAHNMGYARSKLVAERIVQAAAEQTGMISKVLRVGQIVGDTVFGRWNPDEGIPLMIRSATTLGALPALDETPSWTPVDVVAQAVLELSALEAPEDDSAILAKQYGDDPKVIYHLVNSSVFHWTKDLLPALHGAGLEFEIVGQREWIKRLREGEQDPTKNPTVKLTEFFAGKYDNEESRAGLVYSTKLTEQASPSLKGGIDLVSSGIVKKFVDSWRRDWATTV
ncbi:putative NRPS-like enzyme [Hypoxylon trugodes]|uniref:putative NRPS-like enzyme n=1 Tax=Hypoxylon trugodes TaxID=326681 RepID=UPI00219A7B77|nr:putative NRPS-like enzyme [Hypoxylon trugodes]KAI1390433.1 putative NRPS-like enzyme [Hypoxylon trugodes]